MRTTFLTALAAAAGAALAPAAPVPKEVTEPYFPTKVGTKLVYRDEQGADEWVLEVKAAAKTKDGVAVETEYRPGEGPLAPNRLPGAVKQTMLVSDKGVFRTAMNGKPFSDPLCLLKLPHVAGAGWDTAFSTTTTNSKGTSKAGKAEEVKVPAGTFTAIPVTHEYVSDDKWARSNTTWYAPGVGEVKYVTKSGDKETVKLLVSVTVPKD